MAADVEGDVYVLVVHAFEYTGNNGRRVAIPPNELYRPLWRSTEDRWHLRREPGGRPFYLPAQYVRELPALDNPATAAPPGPIRPRGPEPLSYDYRFLSAAAAAVPSGPPREPRGGASSLCGPAQRGAATQRTASGCPRSLSCPQTVGAGPGSRGEGPQVWRLQGCLYEKVQQSGWNFPPSGQCSSSSGKLQASPTSLSLLTSGVCFCHFLAV
ncbi:PREDICTED: LOW QUALITY PROTEIN: rho GTPase-activating protein 27-like [Rhinopithecus bieti]|uniref:LOW QUALITY PROTEIN: rho GTPase-activating protein 27-like n=1 Tax=Rhinopithecus bieti TaxID=61621 RepID=UPI00083BEB61|nr:PREDICTED: LOW QUALITY PROTEIN: rho GTPase-activating protein 27-like [Rhinopithecus bieti]